MADHYHDSVQIADVRPGSAFLSALRLELGRLDSAAKCLLTRSSPCSGVRSTFKAAVKRLTIALVTAALGALLPAASASDICSTMHGDPLPGYEGPWLVGIHCSYVSGPTESWTVPAIAEAEFDLFGASHPIGGEEARASHQAVDAARHEASL